MLRPLSQGNPMLILAVEHQQKQQLLPASNYCFAKKASCFGYCLTTVPVRAWAHLNLEEASCRAETAGQTEVYAQAYITVYYVQYPRL